MYDARITMMGEEWLQWIDIPDEGIGAAEEQVQVLTVVAEKGGVKLGFKEEEDDCWFQQMVAGVEEAEEAHKFLNPAYIYHLNQVFDERVGVISDLNPNLNYSGSGGFNGVEEEEEDMRMGPQWKKRRTCLQPPFHHSRSHSRCRRTGKKNVTSATKR